MIYLCVQKQNVFAGLYQWNIYTRDDQYEAYDIS